MNETFNRQPLVYIASPYTAGDPAINLAASMDAWHSLFDMNVAPLAPLLSHYLHVHKPRPYQAWTAYDLQTLSRCDAVFAIKVVSKELANGVHYAVSESKGRDGEVAFAEAHGIPVFWDLDDLREWRDRLTATP